MLYSMSCQVSDRKFFIYKVWFRILKLKFDFKSAQNLLKSLLDQKITIDSSQQLDILHKTLFN